MAKIVTTDHARVEHIDIISQVRHLAVTQDHLVAAALAAGGSLTFSYENVGEAALHDFRVERDGTTQTVTVTVIDRLR